MQSFTTAILSRRPSQLLTRTSALRRSVPSRPFGADPLHQRPFSSESGSSSPSGGSPQSFKAETRSLLSIVTNSIYSNKDVFLRELVSNASDSLTKLAHLKQATSLNNAELQDPLIEITVDKDAGTVAVRDTGVGMDSSTLSDALGTIAKSGSDDFKKAQTTEEMENVIGKFGVGFYSSFMVGEEVTVKSRCVETGGGGTWASDGGGTFTVTEEGSEGHGATVTITVKEDEKEYLEEARIRQVLKKYSSFVPYPIELNGERVEVQKAIWSHEPSQVSADEHEEFFKHLTSGFEVPLHTLHYRADAPLQLQSLLYVPKYHTEKFGLGRMTPAIDLYCRKVLISKEWGWPDWLRFVKGVVDCEDLPLNVSREGGTDEKVKLKLRESVVRRLIAEFEKIKNKKKEKWEELWKEYGHFFKEGACQDYPNQLRISKLLMWQTSKGDGLSTFDDYVGRLSPDQKEIYYLNCKSKEDGMSSPYREGVEGEVILCTHSVDDFVMSNLGTYEGRKIVSLEKGFSDDDASGGEDVVAFVKSVLGERVLEVKPTSRLSKSPALVVDHESGAVRRMMSLVDTSHGDAPAPLPPVKLVVNPEHPILKGAVALGGEVAEKVVEQVLENAVMTAGLGDGSVGGGVERIEWMMERLVAEKKE